MGGSKGYTPQTTEHKHDDDGSTTVGNRSTYAVSDIEPFPQLGVSMCPTEIIAQLREEGGKWWELNNVASERVEEADGSVFVSLEEEEAVDRFQSTVVLKQGELDTDEGSSVKVEEADVATQLSVAGVEAVALRQHHPAARVEAWIGDTAAARADGARPPTGANSAEADVIKKIAGQHAPSYLSNHIPWK